MAPIDWGRGGRGRSGREGSFYCCFLFFFWAYFGFLWGIKSKNEGGGVEEDKEKEGVKRDEMQSFLCNRVDRQLGRKGKWRVCEGASLCSLDYLRGNPRGLQRPSWLTRGRTVGVEDAIGDGQAGWEGSNANEGITNVQTGRQARNGREGRKETGCAG